MEEELRISKNDDLGFGAKVTEQTKTRFINKDGSFNAQRKGVDGWGSFSLYNAMLNLSWPRFYGIVLGLYAAVNLIFTIIYLSIPGVFPELAGLSFAHRFFEVYFYSVQVMTTLGSSPWHPANLAGNGVLAIEALAGLLGFALGAGVVLARFSNPRVRIIFSRHAIISPYQDGMAFEFRIINGKKDELIQVEAIVMVSMKNAEGKRPFIELPLERHKVVFFPLNWTIVHPITEESPLFGLTHQDLTLADAEFLVFVTAIDEALGQRIYIRHSYKFNEILVDKKFANILELAEDGTIEVDPRRIHELEGLAK